MYQKPDATETSRVTERQSTTEMPRYEKPNAYDEETMVVTASRQGSRSSRMTTDSYSSRFFSQASSTPNTSPPSSPKPSFQTITPSILSQTVVTSSILSQSTPTTQMTFSQLDEAENPKTIRRKRSMIVDVLQYFISQKEIYDCDHQLIYRKSTSRSWTSHQMTLMDANKTKLAVVRRKAFNKDQMTIEVKEGETEYLVKSSQTSVLFEYETFFYGYFMRWKRPSLLSNDFTCEIKVVNSTTNNKKDDFIDSDSEGEEDADHDHHNHKTCRRWKLLLEYTDDVDCITIQRQVLNQMDKHDLLKLNLIVTCCTLIDMIKKTF
ncbi:hypothetical protein G6F46_005642 [Rhizopus delemar]|uniref:Uncharacterized protein n=3 Tax=Rhizopus TaxID=4842 RepID=I1BLJ4_RHIO9|nr:hypothetical protein RO3G_01778 [Rhizopus delemar RA 99-880]KAG1047073.1 hypothetical protein G6F43_010464 [Rhizopus delemar]KAG1537879.1 hypothetical protein G6F51_010106 [Rhizopus arrhizus]KAG1451297.1 hypothetical protein G6F55_009252 [Rhizopus delemar]KAG1491798.1 hypothetical protein G6F54_009759 [Rhizopus delemar]|eukprot:EIE77074.1 hypothetical protein RO3G_01778 [Rhizopus delemar RA 99-880]